MGGITENGCEWLCRCNLSWPPAIQRGIYLKCSIKKTFPWNQSLLPWGVRVEHPQELIDQIQYHSKKRPQNLPPASYRLTSQVDGRGVFSFCMCPGGYVIPASTGDGELVLNGMSMSSRSAPMANAGVVVEIRPEDIGCAETKDPLCMLRYQAALEKKVFEASGKYSQIAPAQRMTDFLAGDCQIQFPKALTFPEHFHIRCMSFFPVSSPIGLKKPFRMFDNKMKGFLTLEATILAVESRTSSPIKIPRDPKTLMHPELENLYPCGEGAGHAGGIVSAALDGMRIAEVIGEMFKR
jgi:uncharacterized protein